jgi:DNA polymerase-3 subunit epsilon
VRRSSLERKLVAGILVLFLVPTLLAGAIMVYLYRRGTFDDPFTLALTAGIGFATMMSYLGVMAHTIGRSLVGTLLEIQRGTELMATVNPEHRHRVATGDELQSVAEEINRMADRVRDARLDLEAEVARATSELHAERAKLAAVLSELDEGVVVATSQGRVTLANRAAQELLGGASLLGQSLFDVVDREKVGHFLDRLRDGPELAARFTLHPGGGAVLQAGMTPLLGGQGEMTGFILALRDMSRPAREDEARQRRLEEALLGVRGSLASIRSLAESLIEDPSIRELAAGTLLAAIHSEAVRLSALVTDMGVGSRLGPARAPWRFEEVAVADLLRMSVRRLDGAAAGGGRVEVGEVEPGFPSLRAEVSALSGGLAHLLRTVLACRAPGGKAWLRSRRRSGVLQIDAGAEGRALAADLEACLDGPITIGAARRLTVRDIVRRHAGEVWAYTDDGQAGFRLTLPLEGGRPDPLVVEPAVVPRFVGAGMVSGVGTGAPAPERPQLYDFSFFEEIERHVLPSDRERVLEELTYVIFDTETTGLRPEAGDRIVSVAAVKVRHGAVRRGESFDALVKPERRVPPESSRLHGLTDQMLAEAPPIDVVLPAFARFAEGAVLVGHEVWFDLAFLTRDADRLGLPPLTLAHPILDVRLLSEIVHRSATEHTLDAVAARLGVVIHARHSALGDALATAEIFVRLLPLLARRGIVTLGQALDAARSSRGRGPGRREEA